MPELSMTPDPRRVELERIARDVMDRHTWHAPATYALALIDAILDADWHPPTAAQTPAGYLVGWQDEGRTFLAFDDGEVGILGDRARAYADQGDARQFLAACGPEDPRTQFRVYELREMTDHA